MVEFDMYRSLFSSVGEALSYHQATVYTINKWNYGIEVNPFAPNT